MKPSTPVELLIVNRAASAPPTIEYVSAGAGRSASLAATVVIAAVFSAMLTLALAPPPLLVITGASLTGITSIVSVRTVGSRSTPPLAMPPLSCTRKPALA